MSYIPGISAFIRTPLTLTSLCIVALTACGGSSDDDNDDNDDDNGGEGAEESKGDEGAGEEGTDSATKSNSNVYQPPAHVVEQRQAQKAAQATARQHGYVVCHHCLPACR